MKKIFFFLLINISLISSSNYIIMADDLSMLRLFRDDREQVINIAEEIGEKYDGLIFHLGSTVIFDRGGMFYYRTSQENLKEFINIINKKNKKVYFWFLDSFGSDAFIEIYNEYEEVMEKLFPKLEEFQYDAIVIDLEWINYNEIGLVLDNSKKFKEIILNIETKFKKKVFAFASVVDDEEENKKRGYGKIDYSKLLPMFYIKDAGFYEGTLGEPVAVYSEERIENLRAYYKENFEKIVVSMESGIILKRGNSFHFVRNFRKFDKDLDNIFENLKKTNEFNHKYYIIKEMKAMQDFYFEKNDESFEKINKDEKLYIFETKENFLLEGDIIWEYFIYR